MADKQIDETELEMINAIKEQTCPKLKTKLVALAFQAGEKEKLDKEEEKEMNIIKKKYEQLMAPLLAKQQEIVSGSRAVNNDELEGIEDMLGHPASNEALVDVSGIPQFWLKAMKNSDVVGEEIKQQDMEALASLVSIKVIRQYKEAEMPEKLTLVFTFKENDYFTNQVLEKVFVMDDRDGRPVSSTATQIDWKEGKNLTKSVIKKQQVHKKSGEKRTVQKSVESESFFNLFNDIDVEEDKLDKMDEEEVEQAVERMDIDWSIAEQLEEEVVPYSVEYYLNVITKMPDDYQDIDDSDDEQAVPNSKKACC